MNKKELSKIKQDKLSHERLVELLHYDPKTGIFTNRVNRSSGALKGKKAGGPQRDGYLRVNISGSFYLMHRLAWFYVHGSWPIDQVDHINRIRNDNRISNLREATSWINMNNRVDSSEVKSGAKGILWNKRDQAWSVLHNGKYLGYAKTIKEGLKFQKESAEGVFARRQRSVYSNAAEKQSRVKGVTWKKNRNQWQVEHDGAFLCLTDNIEDAINIKQQAIAGTYIKKDKVRSAHQSGVDGILWHKATGSWQVRVKRKYIGLRKTLAEALLLRLEIANGEYVKGLRNLWDPK